MTETTAKKKAAPKKKRTGDLRIMGAFEAAKCLDVSVHNLDHRLAGLPEPHDTLAATRVWWASDIEEFAVEYHARRAARAAKVNNEGATNGQPEPAVPKV